MEALEAAVGLGKKEQSGQEPVSGMKGTGTAAEPYDSGNQEGAYHVFTMGRTQASKLTRHVRSGIGW